MNKCEKRTFNVSLTKEMLLDLRMMVHERCKNVLYAADSFDIEGCPITADSYREYAEMWEDFANEMEVVYEELFEED
jgi:hypothetical protein